MIRRFHRSIGLSGLIFILATTLTGLLWAYAPYLYWKPGYLKKKQTMASPSLMKVTLTTQEALKVASSRAGEANFTAVHRRSDFGKVLYEVIYEKAGQSKSLLIDAETVEILTPLTKDLAITIARQYVVENPPVKSIAAIENFQHRSGKNISSAFLVTFDQMGDPEIVIDRSSGEVVEESDRTRRFHFFIMQLHQLNFFGFKKTLTIIPGTILLSLMLSGVVLWLRPKFIKRYKSSN